jgi:hypothetical protein
MFFLRYVSDNFEFSEENFVAEFVGITLKEYKENLQAAMKTRCCWTSKILDRLVRSK